MFRPSFRHAVAVGIVVVSSVLLAAPAAAGGGKGKGPQSAGGTSNSITLNAADPHLGDWVTFSYTLAERVKYPRIQVVCSQNGEMVYAEAGPAGQSFLLGGGWSRWRERGGEADCVATLYEWDFTPVQTFIPYATTSFHAGDRR